MRRFRLDLGIAGLAMMFATTAIQPAASVPIAAGASAPKVVGASDVVDVQWRYRRWRMSGFGYGRLGPLDSPHYYYGPPPAHYVERPWEESYYRRDRRYRHHHYNYVEPYPDPFGPLRQCWVLVDKDRGFGYFRPC
jgi:hypothetical protein